MNCLLEITGIRLKNFVFLEMPIARNTLVFLKIFLVLIHHVILEPCVDIEGEAEIEMIGPPDRVISAFGPEVIGENVEGKVLSMEVAEHSGRKYYQFELEPPHVLITATAAGNRLYLFNVTGSGKTNI